MPAFTAIALATTYIASGLTAAGLSAVAATAAANVIVGTTLSLITSKLFAPNVRAPAPKTSSTLNQELAERVRGYGTMLLGGVRAEWHVADGVLYQVILCQTGRVDGLVRYMIGEKYVTTDELNRVTTPPFEWEGREIYHVWLAHREGYPNQAGWDGSDATGSMNSNPNDRHFLPLTEALPKRWKAEDNFAGIACIFAAFRTSTLERYSEIFPEGPQTQIRAEWRLSKVIDPRSGALAWSQNPALCLGDFLTHEDGLRLSRDEIDWDSFAAFADICDEEVPLKAKGTEPRYALGGVYSLLDDPVDTAGRMRATCDAELYETANGKIAVRGGMWQAPTVTITEDHLLGIDLQQGTDAFEAFNELTITYTSPESRYQTEEATKWKDLVDQAERGVVSSEFNVDMVQSASQARRLAKIYRAKQNPPWFGSITTTLVGLRARYVRFIRLIIPSLGIDGPFLVESHSIRADLTGCEMEVRWLGHEAYEWDPDTEEDREAPGIADDEIDVGLPVPARLRLSVETMGDPISQRVVVATVDNPRRDELELQARIAVGSRWEAMNATDDYEAVSGPVLASQTYRVRARFKGPSGAVSDWTDEASITIS